MFLITTLVHVSGSNVCNKLGVVLRGRGPHKLLLAPDNVRIRSLMIHRLDSVQAKWRHIDSKATWFFSQGQNIGTIKRLGYT